MKDIILLKVIAVSNALKDVLNVLLIRFKWTLFAIVAIEALLILKINVFSVDLIVSSVKLHLTR